MPDKVLRQDGSWETVFESRELRVRIARADWGVRVSIETRQISTTPLVSHFAHGLHVPVFYEEALGGDHPHRQEEAEEGRG